MNVKRGDRVLVTGGAWKGNSGEVVEEQITPVGVLIKVDLDNGMSTLVDKNQVRLVKGFPK
jgi:ribosomal protein L24